jgi:hypothetical protein
MLALTHAAAPLLSAPSPTLLLIIAPRRAMQVPKEKADGDIFLGGYCYSAIYVNLRRK